MDRWDGEYGSNFAIPGFTDWVRDMKVPWWVADLRLSYLSYLHPRRVPHEPHGVKPRPEPVDPLGVGMNGPEEFQDLVQLLVQ
jgi:hypothetical protein